ncbi:MAG: hypothetical protein K2N47_01915, partial [Clostridia bacterium]|nr:hypothetical protein [Clostridia bacterium]
MKKKLNLRPCFLFAASLALGIALAQVLIYFSADALYALIPSAAMLIACIIYTAIKRKFSVSLIFLIAIVLYTAGVIYLYFKYAAYCQPSVPLGEFVKVDGVVEEVGLTSAGKQYVIVNHAYAYDTKIDGRIIVYLSENAGDYCRRGYNVTFYTTLGLNDYFSDGGVSFRVTDNVKYYCS